MSRAGVDSEPKSAATAAGGFRSPGHGHGVPAVEAGLPTTIQFRAGGPVVTVLGQPLRRTVRVRLVDGSLCVADEADRLTVVLFLLRTGIENGPVWGFSPCRYGRMPQASDRTSRLD